MQGQQTRATLVLLNDPSPMARLARCAPELRRVAAERGFTNKFPQDFAGSRGNEGSILDSYKLEYAAVLAARKKDPRVKQNKIERSWSSRSFTERSTHEAVALKKMICAMLESEAACGASVVLQELRPKFLRFFGGDLPDPTTLGYDCLSHETWQSKFKGSLATFYHHVSEKHMGELILLKCVRLEGEIVVHPMDPEVHNSQFYADGDLGPDAMRCAIDFFKNKWKRGDWNESKKFCEGMRWYPSPVWQPTKASNYWSSASVALTWHSFDSLVWQFVAGGPLAASGALGGLDGADWVTFGDLYLFFCTSPLLCKKRVHSSASANSKQQAKKQSAPQRRPPIHQRPP